MKKISLGAVTATLLLSAPLVCAQPEYVTIEMEIDVARPATEVWEKVGDYCGISEPAFWRGYGRTRDTSFPAQIRARFYLLYELQKYIVIRIWRRNDPAEALAYKRRAFALARPLIQALGE